MWEYVEWVGSVHPGLEQGHLFSPSSGCSCSRGKQKGTGAMLEASFSSSLSLSQSLLSFLLVPLFSASYSFPPTIHLYQSLKNTDHWGSRALARLEPGPHKTLDSFKLFWPKWNKTAKSHWQVLKKQSVRIWGCFKTIHSLQLCVGSCSVFLSFIIPLFHFLNNRLAQCTDFLVSSSPDGSSPSLTYQ